MASNASTHGSVGRRWLWPLPPLNARGRGLLLRLIEGVRPLVAGLRWLPAAAAAGLLPVGLAYLVRLPGQQWASGLLLFPLFLVCVRDSAVARALGVLAVAFAAHSGAVLLLTAVDADRTGGILPGAVEFSAESLRWVESGADPEYDPARWLPKHLLLLGLVAVFAYSSLGLLVLVRGLYEVDLMNYYVGCLLARSTSTPVALVYGWHVWSVLRGVGCALVLYEVTALSLAALLNLPPAPKRGRHLRLGVGLGLLVLDGALKFLLIDSVQARLQSNLV